MIITKEVEVTLCSKTIDYYESLGYKIPRIKSKWGKTVVPRGTKILVKPQDLRENCSLKFEVECDNCHKRYDVNNQNYNRTKHGDKIYCHSCATKLFNSGENNIFYNPNLTNAERDRIRSHTDYLNFINSVLKRDNYTCQCCGKKSEKLNVHHKNSYDWCVLERTSEENAVTLCQCCHLNFHSRYGNGMNTKEQYNEWLNYSMERLKYINKLSTGKEIYCLEENKIYKNANEFMHEHGLKSNSSIYKVCNKKGGQKRVCGLHVLWYDDYIKIKEVELSMDDYNINVESEDY